MPENENNVWNTLIPEVLDKFGTYQAQRQANDFALASKSVDLQLWGMQNATRAAPSGNLSSGSFNPFPGSWSAYPQADAKSMGSSGVSGGMLALVIGVIIVAVLALFARR